MGLHLIDFSHFVFFLRTANAVCLQYEDVETKTQFVDDYTTDSDCDEEFFEGNSSERKVKFSAASLVNSANSDRLLVDERAHRAQLVSVTAWTVKSGAHDI